MQKKIIFAILLMGILYRLFLTWNGSFLFNMDNARDMVDVREMVELHKLRLIGPRSAIEGVFNGPAWYYLLVIPYTLSGGDPYASIIMEIILWAIGGFFLLKLVSKWGSFLILPIGILWIASDYIVLTNLYAFNPNPLTLLTPVFIYSLYKYLESGKVIYNLSAWFLGGLFFNFEMNFGVFIPIIIFTSLILSGQTKLIKHKSFWAGAGFFLLTLLPQVIFDLKHQFIMSKSIINFLSSGQTSSNLLIRFQSLVLTFYNVFEATLMNKKVLSFVILGLFGLMVLKRWKATIKSNLLLIICLSYIFLPFLGHLLIPVTVNPWHLGGPAACTLILIGFLLREIWDFNIFGKAVAVSIAAFIMLFGFFNILNFFINYMGKPSTDSSLFGNEISAIDYVYNYAKDKNFKVYTYLPSVYDYPYQYLIWWYGLKKFGYLPIDYAYSPNKPEYISNKAYFSAKEEDLKKRENSNLVFLIKEPNYRYTRFGWEGDFISAPNAPKLVSIEKTMVGPIEIEVRRESIK